MGTIVRISRPNGAVQIDDTYKLMSLREKSEHFLSAGTGGVQITLSGAGNDALVAFRCSQLFGTVWRSFRSGGNWSIVFNFRAAAGTVAEAVTFYVFAPPAPAPLTGLVIRTFDGAGNVCADLVAARPIRIAGVRDGNAPFYGTGGRVYAPIILSAHKIQAYYNGVLQQNRSAYYRCSGSNIELQMLDDLRVIAIRRSTLGSYLAADVTHY